MIASDFISPKRSSRVEKQTNAPSGVRCANVTGGGQKLAAVLYVETIGRRTPVSSATSPAFFLPIVMLFVSNIFMTFAWYGHLNYKSTPLWIAILVSWGIAFFEYCLVVPANRLGHSVYSAAELKTIQEVITLFVFAGFSIWFLKEPLTINHAVGFLLILAGAYFIFKGPL